jgi:hypothetical protein
MMKNAIAPVVVLLSIGCSAIISAPAHARGGGPNFMDSPGYQRRLVESRSHLGTTAPYVQPATYSGKKRKKPGKTK